MEQQALFESYLEYRREVLQGSGRGTQPKRLRRGPGHATSNLKKTALNQQRMSYPPMMSLAVARRAQRHVPGSIMTLSFVLARAIANKPPRVPAAA